MYHVLEKEDGSYSPLSADSWENKNCLQSEGDQDEEQEEQQEEEQEESQEVKERLRMNAVTMNKMTDLKTQMEQLNMIKKDKVTNRKKERKKEMSLF